MESDDIYIASPSDDAVAAAAFSEAANENEDGIVHPLQALALVSSGSYVVEWSDEKSDASKNNNNTFSIPVENMSNVITIVYRDGCYTYFRASLLLRRIVDKSNKADKAEGGEKEFKKIEQNIENNIKKWLNIPDDDQYSDTGTATFPVRYQNIKVGFVKVHAKLKERETLRKSLQLKFKKIRTYGPFGVLLFCIAMYVSTWIIMIVATVLGFLGYGLFRPLHRELELTIVPSNSTRRRLDELLTKNN